MPVIFLSVSTLWDGKWHHVSLSHIITLLYCCLAGSGKSCSKTIVKYCPFQLFSLSLYFSNQLFLLMWFFSFYPTTFPNNGLVSWRTVTECQTKHGIPFPTCCGSLIFLVCISYRVYLCQWPERYCFCEAGVRSGWKHCSGITEQCSLIFSFFSVVLRKLPEPWVPQFLHL